MDAVTRNAIVDGLLEMRRLLSKSRADLAALSEREFEEVHEQLEGLIDHLGGLIPGATPPGRIEEFFTQVGEGMVAAQAELDRQSLAYNSARPLGALPSAYRIPKVTADIGFTMARKRSRGFGVFALGRTVSGEKQHTNSVSFEILSVPPSPELLDTLPVDARLVLRVSERNQVRDLLIASEKETTPSAQTAFAMLADFDRVLILTHEDTHLLAHIVPVDDGVPATIQFGVLGGDGLLFSSYGPIPASQAEQGRWVQMRKFLGALSDAQAQLIRPVSGQSSV